MRGDEGENLKKNHNVLGGKYRYQLFHPREKKTATSSKKRLDGKRHAEKEKKMSRFG